MNKIVLLIPYYGQWPAYFNLYIESVRKNAFMLDILFITDLSFPDKIICPANINAFYLSFNDLKTLVDQKLQIKSALTSPYKLCDFKPTYGHLFNEHIENYDFWAFGDIDVIYGDLQKFITNDLLNNHDILQFREKWISGSLTIIRNEKRLNELFLQSKDYQLIFQNPEYMAFDEVSRKWNEIRIKDIFEIQFPYDNFTLLTCQAEKEDLIRIYRSNLIKESLPKGTFMRITELSIFDHINAEQMMYHLVSEKPSLLFEFPTWKFIQFPYFINRKGFFLEKEFQSTFSYRFIVFKNIIGAMPRFIMSYSKKILRKINR